MIIVRKQSTYERRAMLMDYDTIKLLCLQPDDIQDLYIANDNYMIYINITLKRQNYICPRCGGTHLVSKGYEQKNIIHSIFNMNASVIHFNHRRLKCIDCGKSFMEPNPFCDTRQRISNATILQVLKDCKKLNYTYSSIGEKNHISATTVIHIFDQYVDMKPMPLPKILSIDEFYLGKTWKNKFACIFIDWEKNTIIDIFPSRKKYSLYSFMQYIHKKEFDNVKYVSIDMNTTYKQFAHHYCKKSIVMVDSFHVVKNINEALKNLRIHVMYKQDKDSVEYYLLKHWSYLLMKRNGDVENNDSKYNKKIGYAINKVGILELILKIDPILKRAYQWKEDYLNFNEDYTYDNAPQRYDELYNELVMFNINEFKDVLSALKNWREEILNSFIKINERRISNGPIESINGRIKILLKTSLKYKNFERLRNRIMYCINKTSLPTMTNEKKSNKEPGKERGKYKKSK